MSNLHGSMTLRAYKVGERHYYFTAIHIERAVKCRIKNRRKWRCVVHAGKKNERVVGGCQLDVQFVFTPVLTTHKLPYICPARNQSFFSENFKNSWWKSSNIRILRFRTTVCHECSPWIPIKILCLRVRIPHLESEYKNAMVPKTRQLPPFCCIKWAVKEQTSL